jgi:hypothetical protein
MEDKTFLPKPILTSRRSQITTEEWIAPLKREIEELDRLLNEQAELLGLPPLDQPASASSNRR